MWQKFDYILLITVVALATIGLMVLSSAMIGYKPEVVRKSLIVQIGGFIVGVGIAIGLSFVDYIIFKHIAIFFYAANIFMMLLIYTPLAKEETYGGRNWLDFGVITYQPSELMKLATIIMVAVCLEEMRQDNGRILYNVFRIGFFFGLPLIMVLSQKDLGTALVFVCFFVAMVFVAGLKLRYFAAVGTFLAIAFPFVWKFYLSKDEVRSARLISFLNPENDPQKTGFQALKAKWAIGSGQLTGKGIGNGPMNNALSVPIKDSDFIFSVIGEELGFIGTSVLVVIFMIMLIKMVNISRKSADYFGEYVSIGIFAMFAFHFLENVGMNIGLMPITGIPLPFISVGGSALLTNFVSIGVLLSISARRKVEGFFSEEN